MSQRAAAPGTFNHMAGRMEPGVFTPPSEPLLGSVDGGTYPLPGMDFRRGGEPVTAMTPEEAMAYFGGGGDRGGIQPQVIVPGPNGWYKPNPGADWHNRETRESLPGNQQPPGFGEWQQEQWNKPSLGVMGPGAQPGGGGGPMPSAPGDPSQGVLGGNPIAPLPPPVWSAGGVSGTGPMPTQFYERGGGQSGYGGGSTLGGAVGMGGGYGMGTVAGGATGALRGMFGMGGGGGSNNWGAMLGRQSPTGGYSPGQQSPTPYGMHRQSSTPYGGGSGYSTLGQVGGSSYGQRRY